MNRKRTGQQGQECPRCPNCGAELQCVKELADCVVEAHLCCEHCLAPIWYCGLGGKVEVITLPSGGIHFDPRKRAVLE